jgi:hypothetical protein
MTCPNDCDIGFTMVLDVFRQARGIDMPLPCVRTGTDRRVFYARK